MPQANCLLVPATELHAMELAPIMRIADVDEAYAAAGATPLEALMSGIKTSVECTAALDSEGTFCIWGVSVGVDPTVAVPWLLGASRLITDHKQDFLREVSLAIVRLKKQYARLENWVDARNRISVVWLAQCGYTIHPAEPYGFLQLPFHRFEMKGEL